MKIKRKVQECERIPSLYGLAYYDCCSRYAICYPVPLNILIRLARNIWYSLVCGLFRDKYNEDIRLAEARGRNEGYEQGKQDNLYGLKDTILEMRKEHLNA